MIKLVRCDDRMIHGQCIVRILGDFNIECIIGVDNFTSDNAVLKNIYKLAMPPHVKGGVYNENDAIGEIRQHIGSGENTLVLVKSPHTALVLFQAVDDMPKALNIGPMSSRKDAKKATMYAYLNDGEIEALDKMAGMGVRVYFNQIMGQKIEEWEAVKAGMK